ncbi:hypothetical protein BDD12DRAFT_909112 [Trichophaea hybrida]|nr:hypothetical protein BDD12DRAFT_909112 [Trichophaea hybrida]
MASHQRLTHFLVFLLFFTFSVAASIKKIHLPAPSGPHKNIGTFTHTLTDHSRPEKYAPGTSRKVLVQAFYPISQPGQQYAPYAPKLTLDVVGSSYGLPNGTIEPIITNSFIQSYPKPKGKNLVPLLFSTGSGVPRFLYTTMYEEMASQGYFVIAIDHPYDALIVEFPEGGVAYMVNSSSNDLNSIIESLGTRVADAKFVAKQLTKLPCASALDLDKIGMFGHSLGGATAAGAMTGKSPLVKAGLNLDGSFFGPLNTTDVQGPFLLVGRPEHNSENGDPTWKSWRKAQHGWVKEVTFKGFTHATFSDEGTDVELLGLKRFFPPGHLEKELGTVKPKRGRQLVAAYVGAFFGFAFGGDNSHLLAGPSKEYPEVGFVI